MIHSKKVEDFWRKLNRISEILILIYLAECVLGSSGRWLEIGPISIRMVLFAACFITTFPALIMNIKTLSKNYQIIFTVIFGIYYCSCALIGVLNDNSLSFIVADMTSMMALLLLPGFIAVMGNEQSIKKAINVIFYSAVALAAITVVLHFIMAFISDYAISEINIAINEKDLGGLATLATGIQRIYFKSQIFLQVAILFGIWKIANKTIKESLWLLFFEGLLFTACILSYTRGFWLGLFVSVLIILISYPKQIKQCLKIAAAVLIVFCAFVGISAICYHSPCILYEIANRFDPNLFVGIGSSGNPVVGENNLGNSIVDENNMAAVNMRRQTLIGLKEKISQKPIFGHGLGTNLDAIRQDGKTEYMYHDLIMKTGIIGLILAILTFYGFIISHVKSSIAEWKIKKFDCDFHSDVVRNRFLITAYIGIAITSIFNPFLFTPMGIAVLSLVCAAIFSKNSKITQEELQ